MRPQVPKTRGGAPCLVACVIERAGASGGRDGVENIYFDRRMLGAGAMCTAVPFLSRLISHGG